MNKNALQKTVRRATAWCLVLSLAGAPALPVFAQVTTEWSLEQYQQLSNDMAAADELVLLVAPGSEDWRSASQSALDARRALVVYISNALRSGSMPADFVEPATQARFVLIQNIIDLTADLGLVLVQVVGVRQEIDVVPESERAEPTDLVVITLRGA